MHPAVGIKEFPNAWGTVAFYELSAEKAMEKLSKTFLKGLNEAYTQLNNM